MTWIVTIWHFVIGWAGVDMIVGFIALAIAILEPKFLDAVTDLRKWAIVVAAIAFTATGLIAHGYKNGLAEKQHQWDAALERELAVGEAARDQAERSMPPVSSDRSVLRSDPFNRNRSGKREPCQ